MKTYTLRALVLTVCLLLILPALPACNHIGTLQPKLTGIQRGAAQIDVYGKWTRKLVTLGRGSYVMTYELSYARAGTTIKYNTNTGAITSGTLNPLTSAQIVTTFTVATNRATLANPSTTTDANGRATVSITPTGGTRPGPETLTITIDYNSSSGTPLFSGLTDTDDFEVNIPSTTAWE